MGRPKKPEECDCGETHGLTRVGKDYVCPRCRSLETERKSLFTSTKSANKYAQHLQSKKLRQLAAEQFVAERAEHYLG